MSLVGLLAKGFGPTSGGGGSTPPAAPTLSVVDNGDGTATATVAGADSGTTNTVLLARWTGAIGTVDYSAAGSRSGNGAVNLTLDPGYYVAYVESALAGLATCSEDAVYFRATTSAGTSAGFITAPKQALIDILAESPAFQAKVGASAPSDARAYIHTNYLLVDNHALERPYAIVATAAGDYDLRSGGARNFLRPQGTLWLYLCDQYRSADSAEDIRLFENYCGEVLDEIAELAAVDDRLAIAAIAIAVPPTRSERWMEGLGGAAREYCEASFTIDWGD